MSKMEDAIVELLQGNISIADENVPVIIRNKPIDKTPCITISQATNSQLQRQYQHDPYEKIRYKYQCQIWVNIWCDTENERELLVNQIHLVFNQAIANHYLRCSNYDDGICTFWNDVCGALTVTNGRTAKSQCPNPKENSYTSFFKKNNIIKNTFTVDGETELDELDINPPVLRTQIRVNMDYYDYYYVGGALFENAEVHLNEQ